MLPDSSADRIQKFILATNSCGEYDRIEVFLHRFSVKIDS